MSDQDDNNNGLLHYIYKFIHHLFALIGFTLVLLIFINFILNKYKNFHLLTKNWYVLSEYTSFKVNN
jgi:hypothetical protein